MQEEVNAVKSAVEAQLRSTRQELSLRCGMLSADLEVIAKRLDEDVSDSSIILNSLGEVQGQGGIIDSLCGKFWALNNAHRLINTLRK